MSKNEKNKISNNNEWTDDENGAWRFCVKKKKKIKK